MLADARLIFFGTPEFAVPTLAALVEAGSPPLLVVSRPAKPVGRKHDLRDPPVALWARAHGLEVAQPVKARDEDFLTEVARLRPDFAVVVAYGQIFGRRLLNIPERGSVNLHASLLPRHRGAAPVQAALAAGDEVTGVTSMLMSEGLDTGPILLQREVAIGADETAGELAGRLALAGAELIVETLSGLAFGEIVPRAQDEALATYAPRIAKEAARVDWMLPAPLLRNLYRAHTPWPGMEARWRNEPVKLLRLAVGRAGHADLPGTVLFVDRERVTVACGGETAIDLFELQRSGRRALSAADFANGERLLVGARFT